MKCSRPILHILATSPAIRHIAPPETANVLTQLNWRRNALFNCSCFHEVYENKTSF